MVFLVFHDWVVRPVSARVKRDAWVYVLSFRNGKACKIGCTCHTPRRRLQEWRCKDKSKGFKLVYSVQVSEERMFGIEHEAHQQVLKYTHKSNGACPNCSSKHREEFAFKAAFGLRDACDVVDRARELPVFLESSVKVNQQSSPHEDNAELPSTLSQFIVQRLASDAISFLASNLHSDCALYGPNFIRYLELLQIRQLAGHSESRYSGRSANALCQQRNDGLFLDRSRQHSTCSDCSVQEDIEKEMVDAGLIPPPQPALSTLPLKTENPRDSTVLISLNSRSGKNAAVDEEEEAIRMCLEAIGLHVGANFAESVINTTITVLRLCRDRSLFTETLDVIKFVCKDLWAACWDRQVDNLRTNHRLTKSIQGIYVLQDNAFKTITRLSSWEGRANATRKAKLGSNSIHDDF
ncbi:hypothetical protein D9758_017484 [Tetrapyrgos nigripes]|uniref:Uncharacterized protein n=1 Tax=Tetrapyrgos nigripes TaxID=182062 RepID=A0A8H5FF78_9AGAR|nr:hypothetical protein D9758_017484 [Tetrapyrgos nigripes]